jgi:hypothetical protein
LHVDSGQLDTMTIVALIDRCRQAFDDHSFPGSVALGKISTDHGLTGPYTAN